MNEQKALSSIKRIAKTPDRQRAVVFFLFFARFEYALKRAGFARMGRSKDAEVNWTKYAACCDGLLANSKQSSFHQAVDYLRRNPPKKQILSGDRLEFADDSFAGAWNMDRVLTLVRRMRNNLFHGGKNLVGDPKEAVSRDRKLLDAGLAVMQACLDWDAHLNSLFLEELERC